LIDVGCDGDRLAGWLSSIGVRYIPVIALTHNDEDHVQGLPALVHKYLRRIGDVLFLIDRDPTDIPFYLDAQSWAEAGVISSTTRLETPLCYRRGMGRTLVEEPVTSYRLYCTFPTMQQTEAAVRGAPTPGPRLGRGPNDTSGVIRLARRANPGRTRFLFGGDLNYPGWKSMDDRGVSLRTDVLVAPHHGAPRGESDSFGPAQLAAVTRPKYALFSVGTRQRHVRASTEATARHPLPDVVQAFRRQHATVLCTQITRRCANLTSPTPSIVPLPSIIDPHTLHPSGISCAGTILIVLRANGRIVVSRLADHQSAVDGLRDFGHAPLCRP
jgi:glyoxylase-like metal-dependent hydrolase (beta-lactamase superfamily II)